MTLAGPQSFLTRIRGGLCLAIVSFAVPALAGTISLDVSVTVDKRELDMELTVLVVNRGDDTAYHVKPSASLGDTVFLFEPLTVGAGKRRTFRARQKVPAIAAMKPGDYPVPVTVSYLDAEGAQLYGPAYGILRAAKAAYSPPFAIQAEGVTLQDRAQISVRIQAMGPQNEQLVTVTPHTSLAVGIRPANATAQVTPGPPAVVTFELLNRSGQAGSAMPLLLFVESESDDAHGTLVHEVPLTITSDSPAGDPDSPPRVSLRFVVGLAIGLVLLAGGSTIWIMTRDSQAMAARTRTKKR